MGSASSRVITLELLLGVVGIPAAVRRRELGVVGAPKTIVWPVAEAVIQECC